MINKISPRLAGLLVEKSLWVRKETLKINALAPDTRLASSLSAVEIFVTLYYGGIINIGPTTLKSETRDRFVISKGHGAISLYPILADKGFFSPAELGKVCQKGALLGGIPDPVIPGFETVNGSLGHGLGIACGMALALKNKNNSRSRVFALIGDGELCEGSVWEAVMFAGQHKIGNLIVILDNNKISMLDYCRKIIDLEPIGDKFADFGWKVKTADGHDPERLYSALKGLKKDGDKRPKLLIADTVKGKGVAALEKSSLCHILNLSRSQIEEALRVLK